MLHSKGNVRVVAVEGKIQLRRFATPYTDDIIFTYLAQYRIWPICEKEEDRLLQV